MAHTPPPHPNTRPRVDGRSLGNAGDRAFVGGGGLPMSGRGAADGGPRPPRRSARFTRPMRG